MSNQDPAIFHAPVTDEVVPLDNAARETIAALVSRQQNASGVLMKAVNYVGGHVESGLRALPQGTSEKVEGVVRFALEKSFNLAGRSRTGRIGRAIGTDRLHRGLATVSGAVGGVAGIGTALTELPFAITIIFRAVQAVAEQYGEDPMSPKTRVECLAVFGKGGPDAKDDGIDTAFISARLSLTGPALKGLISAISPKFATLLSQKIASQSVPVLGAIAGAGTNYAFVDYYVQIAHVHFGLRQLARKHGEDAVTDEFHRVLAETAIPTNQA